MTTTPQEPDNDRDITPAGGPLEPEPLEPGPPSPTEPDEVGDLD
ncbi:hypothetical protein [Nocardioides sp.]|jgi:hypothetical protein